MGNSKSDFFWLDDEDEGNILVKTVGNIEILASVAKVIPRQIKDRGSIFLGNIGNGGEVVINWGCDLKASLAGAHIDK